MIKHINAALEELDRARTIHPDWPDTPVEQVAIMVAEAGEALGAASKFQYEGEDYGNIKEELIQTAAMCLRCLESLEV